MPGDPDRGAHRALPGERVSAGVPSAEARAPRAAGPWGLLALATLAASPLVAAFAGARGPFLSTLNFGPGDGPYTFGFTSSAKPYQPYEIYEGVATHWASPDATVDLPLTVRGRDVALGCRFARPLPDPAEVELSLNDRLIDHFAPLKKFQERRVDLGALGETPLRLKIRVISRDSNKLGLRMDWIRWQVDPKGSVALEGAARWRPALTVTVLVLLFLGAGCGVQGAAALAAPWSLAVTLGLLWDPWLVYRLLRWVPEALAIVGVAAVGLGRLLRARGRLQASDLRAVAALGISTFLLRGVALNHPDYYYPDLLIHFGLVEVVRDAGPDLLRAPAHHIWRPASPGAERAYSGLWPERVDGRVYRFPYSVAFHIPFAFLPFDCDTVLTAFKLAGALVTTVPLLLVFAMARRVGAPPLGALLLAFVPLPVAKLTVAALPALLGDAMNTAFLVWLVGHADEIRTRRGWIAGALFVAATQLAYPSGVVITGLVVANLAVLLALLEARPECWRRGLALLAMGLAGSLLSLGLYYRDFLGGLAVLAGGSGSSTGGAASLSVGVHELGQTLGAWPLSFGWVTPLLAAAGLLLVLRRGKARAVLLAWILTFVELQLLRGIPPFRWVYHLLFVTPLACLGAGEALASLASRGGRWRLLASAVFFFLAAQGLTDQWTALVIRLGHAR